MPHFGTSHSKENYKFSKYKAQMGNNYHSLKKLVTFAFLGALLNSPCHPGNMMMGWTEEQLTNFSIGCSQLTSWRIEHCKISLSSQQKFEFGFHATVDFFQPYSDSISFFQKQLLFLRRLFSAPREQVVTRQKFLFWLLLYSRCHEYSINKVGTH